MHIPKQIPQRVYVAEPLPLKGIRLTIENGEYCIGVKYNLKTHQFKQLYLTQSKESAIKKIAELIGVDITVK